MTRPPIVPLSTLLLLATVLPASGQLVIDDFTTAQMVNHSTINASTTNETTGAGILGGVRAIRLTQGASAGTLSGTAGSGAVTMTTDTLGDLELWWDGVDDDAFNPTGLGGQDLTSGGSFDRFLLDVTANTLPAEQMRLQVWSNGSDRCEVLFAMPVGPLEIPFASLGSCTGAATPTSVVQAAGVILLRTVLRPGAWSFTLGAVESTPVELLSLSVE